MTEALATIIAAVAAGEGNIEIPAGKVKLAEYGTIGSEPRATRHTIEVARGEFREYTLYVKTPGWAIAGSMLRWDNGSFGVSFEMGNSTHSRNFKTYEEARAIFDKWTAPVAA